MTIELQTELLGLLDALLAKVPIKMSSMTYLPLCAYCHGRGFPRHKVIHKVGCPWFAAYQWYERYKESV